MKTTNNKKQLIAALAAVAALNPDGYTVDARTLQPVTSGYAVAVLDTQNSFGPDGLARVVDYVAAHDHVTAFGGWLDSETGLYYYDATIICSTLEEAKDMARKNKQLAIFCLDTLKEIRM